MERTGRSRFVGNGRVENHEPFRGRSGKEDHRRYTYPQPVAHGAVLARGRFQNRFPLHDPYWNDKLAY